MFTVEKKLKTGQIIEYQEGIQLQNHNNSPLNP
jgi:hypothetical protein